MPTNYFAHPDRRRSRSVLHAWIMELFVSPSADSQYVCYHSAFCGDGDPRPVFVLGRTAEDCCGQPNVMSAQPREIGAAENCSSCGE